MRWRTDGTGVSQLADPQSKTAGQVGYEAWDEMISWGKQERAKKGKRDRVSHLGM